MSLGASAFQMRLRNNYLHHPDDSRPMDLLPQISHLALKGYWLIYTLPLVWLIVSVLLISALKKNPEKRDDWIQLHTSATLFIGAGILLFFVTAGMLPFTSAHLYLSK
ncbi:hypothetical protein M2103_000749 [Ereboglobus sp. PH5-5]|uniref:hypothetical protein n=1 Tax=Ereboglobus sp. PH5-5 TaxID=2940529 RepID=UPI00240685B1|nr:hypothetical protein [Ereboglobus sp. PH5-5]MDF9832539.1 hypothetical protein [Ereboglobus sp. PH5-5]